jgi:hypothetical protein
LASALPPASDRAAACDDDPAVTGPSSGRDRVDTTAEMRKFSAPSILIHRRGTAATPTRPHIFHDHHSDQRFRTTFHDASVRRAPFRIIDAAARE